jgi:hypothetical protein
MGFLATYLMHKISRADAQEDQRRQAEEMSKIFTPAGIGQQVGGQGMPGQQSAASAVWDTSFKPQQQAANIPMQNAAPSPMANLMSYAGQQDPNALMAAATPGGVAQPQTGLMGQNAFAPRMSQIQQMMTNPYTMQSGLDLYKSAMLNQMTNQGQMERQVQGQDFRMGQEMPFQRETSMMLQAMQNQQSGKNAMMMTPQQVLQSETGLRKEYEGQAAPIRSSLRAFQDTQKAMQAAGGDFDKLPGAGQIQMVKNFAKMILPNEAVMAGDENAIANVASANLGGTVDNWMNWFNGKGTIPSKMVGQMYQTMQQIATARSQEGDQLNQRYSELAAGQMANPSRVIREMPKIVMEQKRSNSTAAIPGSTPSMEQMPATAPPAPDLEPVNTSMFGKPTGLSNRRSNRGQR